GHSGAHFGFKEYAMRTQRKISIRIAAVAVLAAAVYWVAAQRVRTLRAEEPSGPPTVVEIKLDDMVQPISADYIKRGIERANEVHAAAVLLTIDTPGGLESSMREIIQAILESQAPVIAYVSPEGGRAASAGFFILISSDVAVMAPGTHAGAAHPVVIGAMNLGKTMEEKIENDAAAYIRSLADRRGRNSKFAEEGVRQSKSYTEKEALADHLIDSIENTPEDIFKDYDGKTINRFNGGTTTLHLAGASIVPYTMTARERFLFYIVDPNIAFLLVILGIACLYVEFTHPGMVLPGVIGAIAIVLALFAFHLLPINYIGVVLILLALAMFALEVKTPSHGVLAVGGIVSMVIGALILIDSPWPAARIHLSTALAVTIPFGAIVVILLRLALAAHRRKVVTGEAGMVDSVGIAQTALAPDGKVLVHGEIWEAHAASPVALGARVRVREVRGLTLWVEPERESQ
ncbi:MAG TPA: nodulation protein NfeD, partial [Terriglobia bacterium]|nr:nodulation protein NfeD [Terriglobia bacterium]